MKRINVIIDKMLQDDGYVEYVKKDTINTVAIELYNDIISQDNFSVVSINEKETVLNNGSIQFEIVYDIWRSAYRNIQVPISFTPVTPIYEYRFSWGGMIKDIKKRLINILMLF